MHRSLGFCAVLAVWANALAADGGSAIPEALAELRRGDFAAAERTLQPEVKARPNDGAALSLLGVALDGQKKFPEAEAAHRRAAACAPNSPDVWNNYANHLLGTGDAAGARTLYLKVLALDPASYNANVQLARLSVKQKNAAEALGYLKHLPDGQQEAANLVPLRIEALYMAGQASEADQLTSHWLAAAKGNLAASFAIGLALADAGKLDGAEASFSQALAVAPSDFNVLFNLGAVEWRAANYSRAREVLEAAERLQPQNVDVLYTLAAVEEAGKRPEQAVVLLARAARLAPERSDVQKLLALATADLGALEDSVAAWDRYLKLEPKDEAARRERGFANFRMGRFEAARQDLEWFAGRHPEDALVHYELALLLEQDDPAKAFRELNRAVELKPDFTEAHSARGSLYYQMGKPEEALPDLEAAARLSPADPVSLDRLGQVYLALDRAADAARVLRKAVELAPGDSKTLFHLARALADAGETAESKGAMDRFRQLGPAVNKGVPGGLVDYLSLTPEERHADYRRRVEKQVREQPENAAAQVQYLELLIQDGEPLAAREVARKIAALAPAAPLLTEAGRALLAAGQYPAARELLERAAATAPSADLQMDLALAVAHTSGPAAATRLLDDIPPDARGGDYYLARAEMLDASGDAPGAAAAIEKALHASSAQPAVYLRACVFLMRQGRAGDALRVSAEAAATWTRDRQIRLLHAVALEQAGRTAEAEASLVELQNRFPEWQRAWAADGIILGTHGHPQEAASALRIAVALGGGAEIKRYLDQISSGKEARPPELIALLLQNLPDN